MLRLFGEYPGSEGFREGFLGEVISVDRWRRTVWTACVKAVRLRTNSVGGAVRFKVNSYSLDMPSCKSGLHTMDKLAVQEPGCWGVAETGWTVAEGQGQNEQ